MDAQALSSSSRPPHQPSFTPRHRLVSTSTAMAPPSPKRLRQTPSPAFPTSETPASSTSSQSCIASSSSSTRSRMRAARPTLADKRAVTFDRHIMTSPYRGPEGSADFNVDYGLARRREMSVPLLSQTLSHFSLSHTSPPSPQAARPPRTPAQMTAVLPFSAMDAIKTPKSASRPTQWTPGPPLPGDLSYPSTAPLPHAATFLGSPFSSKHARGSYRYNSHSDSPSAVKAAMTEKLPQGSFAHLDWSGRSEWMADEAIEDEDHDDRSMSPILSTNRSSRSRRDTSGSASSAGSTDDFSGSGTSSASLLSLGRSSDEHKVRPGVAIWGDNFHEEEHSDTPVRTLFVQTSDSEGAIQMSVKPKKPSPTSSRRSKSPSQTPRDQTGPCLDRKPSTSPGFSLLPRSSKAPFTSFIPRLLSIRRPPLSRSTSNATTRDDDDATDTEDFSSPSARCVQPSSDTLCDTPTLQLGGKPGLIGLGLSVGATDMDRSFSSDSSGSISSPSKPPSARASAGQLSVLALTPGAGPPRNKSSHSIAKDAQPKAQPATLGPDRVKPMRPLLRRGITEPRLAPKADAALLHPHAVQTPPASLFDDIKPSPAAFASTGLVKKKSNLPMFIIPKFVNKSSPARTDVGESPVSPLDCHRPPSSVETILTDSRTMHSQGSGTSVGSATANLQQAQRTRGLRRKGSTMFAASGSIGSIGSFGDRALGSPATPTKPNIPLAPYGLGITTPSPVASSTYYPFAPSSSTLGLSTPPSSATKDPVEEIKDDKSIPNRLKHHRGPIARASNPMLVSAYRAHGAVKETGGIRNRLERDFVLIQSLGAGAFSQVWKVKDRKEGKLWAVKAGKPFTGVKNRLRQLEEVSILHSLSRNAHPNIIAFVDSWEFQHRLYLRTEIAECGDLARFLEALGDTGGLGEIRCWKLLSELSGALQHIHSQNIIHLDVKPSNILITRTGSLKLADFGMSTVSDPSGQAAALSPALPQMQSDGGFVWSEDTDLAHLHPRRSSSGPPAKLETVPSPIIDREVEGDREYLCPEALQDGSVSREADIFSLGIMLLECALNVVLPPNGDGWVKLRNDDFTDLAEHQVTRRVGDWRQVDRESGLPVISPELMAVVEGLMRSDKAQRMGLGELEGGKVMRNVRQGRAEGWLGAACVEEDEKVMQRLMA